jgi:hypothetical protein
MQLPNFIPDSYKLDRDIRTGVTDIAGPYIICYDCFKGSPQDTFTNFILISDRLYGSILISCVRDPSKKIRRNVLKELHE